MDNQVIRDNTPNIPNQLAPLVDETIGKTLLDQVNYCRILVGNFIERYNTHSKKILSNIEHKSMTGFLFESIDITNDIKESLEIYVQESNNKEFNQALVNLNLEVLKHLNIEDEIKLLVDKSSQSIFIQAQDRLKNSLNHILKKNAGNLKTAECYQYFKLFHDVLQIHIEKIGDFEKRRLDILINLWDKTKSIEDNISILSDSKYDLDSVKNEFNQGLNFDDTEKLVGDLEEEGNVFIQSLKGSISRAFESLENENHVHQEHKERNKRKFTPDEVFKAAKAIVKGIQREKGNWYNTLLALTDDWELELEISSLKFQILKSYFTFIQYVDFKLKVPFDEKMKSMGDLTESLFDLFKPTEDGDADELILRIKKSKLDYRRKLVLRFIPDIKGLLLNSDLPKKVDEFEQNTAKQFNALSKSRFLIKNPVYNLPIDQSELQKISPHDLVSFDMQPEFMEVFPSLKNALIRQLQVLQEKLDEIPEIVDFSIESALRFYEEKKDWVEALKIGSEGIKRAHNKIEDISDLRRDFYSVEVGNMKDKIIHLFAEISEITDNENALQIKIRVTKAKAIEQSKAFRDKIFNNIKNFLPQILNQIRSFYEYLVKSSIKIRKKLEGESAKSFITSDVSDYLAETEEAVNRLPFVYQRLFKLEPLTTFDLYIERQKAYDDFKLAYSRWKNGKFAPTIISGEKGSGKTSFVNRFLAAKSIHEQIIYHDLHQEYLEPEVAYEKLYESIRILSTNQQNKELDNPKRIVVIDGLEKLFEAKINGFNVLQKTMQLISKTNNEIFWIVACHLYSYKYLERSFNISEYFGYHIELEDLPAEELIKIIEKRHNISGFRLNFLPAVQKKSMIPKIKQTDKKDQLELRDVYFERLQKIVRGNITQAFLYWMRSAAEVTEDIIYINTQGDTKLDFIRSISLSKFEILKNILIHNGISSNKHSEIFRIPFEKSELQLQQMFDDGIIVKRSEFYNINPMIYKQVIDQMYKLNLLH